MVDFTNPEECLQIAKLIVKKEHYKVRLMINLWCEIYLYRSEMGAEVPQTAVEHSIAANKYLWPYRDILDQEEITALIELTLPDRYKEENN